MPNRNYAEPLYAGLGSDDRACSKVIKQVLDVLSFPDQRFSGPALPSSDGFAAENFGISFEHDCRIFKMKLFQLLRESGWILHFDEHGLTVRRER